MNHRDSQWANRKVKCTIEIASGPIGEGSVP